VEFRSVFNKLGISQEEVALRKKFDKIDEDGSGEITFEEFKPFVV